MQAIEKEVAYHGGTDYSDYGMVLMCSLYDKLFTDIFDHEDLMNYFNAILGDGCIVYTYPSSSLPPNSRNFGDRLHVDLCGSTFTILDYGCGNGALFDYLNRQYQSLTHFNGFDISNEMIQKSKEQFGEIENRNWITSVPDGFEADYVISSGIFKVKLDTSDTIWTEYILNTIDKLNIYSRKRICL